MAVLKPTIARGVIAAALVAGVIGLVLFLSRPRPTTDDRTNAPAAQIVNAPASVLPNLQAPPAALDRAGFLAAAAEAADAYATGHAQSAAIPLIGRQFVVRIPFGCFGPSPSGQEDQAYWRSDPARRAITVGVRPQVWTSSPLRASIDPLGAAEAIEGFWLPRPWIRTDACPRFARPSGEPNAPRATPTVGLAALYGKDAARTQRRDGRPYEITKAAPDAQPPGPFVLVLSGRITGFPDGASFRCTTTSPDLPPVCVAGVDFSRIAIETQGAGETLAEWGG
jgi:hypothetical protein